MFGQGEKEKGEACAEEGLGWTKRGDREERINIRKKGGEGLGEGGV